jgi:hypothetical protein
LQQIIVRINFGMEYKIALKGFINNSYLFYKSLYGRRCSHVDGVSKSITTTPKL